MILAGVLLKLGGYGLLRVFPVLFRFDFRFGFVRVALRLVGGFFVSLFYMRQTDLKSLIAYSSVAHISMVIGVTKPDIYIYPTIHIVNMFLSQVSPASL
jgi:NADH-ubiquinone oxidoreductase chain 4